MANGRCRLHGGATPKGLASANFVHGRHVEILDGEFRRRYQQAINDPDLISMNSEIALIDVRIAENLERLMAGDGHAAGWFTDLKVAADMLERAIRQGDSDAFADMAHSLLLVVQRGPNEGELWQEMLDLMEQRRKLAREERQHRVTMQLFATVEDQMTLVSRLAYLVKAHVKDPKALRAIAAGLDNILGAPITAITTGGGGGE